MGGLGERQRPQPYERLFENPPRSVVERKIAPSITSYERKGIQEALPEFYPSDLTNLIQSLFTAEEIGTPREKCFTEMNDPVERLHSGVGSLSPTSACMGNVKNLKYKLDSIQNVGLSDGVDFNDFECAVYCLLTNLPAYFDTEREEDEDDEETRIRFDLSVYIALNRGDSDSNLKVEIKYSETEKKHKATVSEVVPTGRTTDISIEDAIDLILYYGNKSLLIFSVDSNNNYVTSFINKDGSQNEVWNILEVPYYGSLFGTQPAD